jgi:hypothetical protein
MNKAKMSQFEADDYYWFNPEQAIHNTLYITPRFYELPAYKRKKVVSDIKRKIGAHLETCFKWTQEDNNAKSLAKDWAKDLDITEILAGETPVAIVPLNNNGLPHPAIDFDELRQGVVRYLSEKEVHDRNVKRFEEIYGKE